MTKFTCKSWNHDGSCDLCKAQANKKRIDRAIAEGKPTLQVTLGEMLKAHEQKSRKSSV